MRWWFVVALAFALSGCLGDAPASPDTVLKPDAGPIGQRVHVFKGTFAPAGPETQTFTFEVPNGSAEVEGLLLWDGPGVSLSFVLYGPSGDETARGWQERDGRAYVTTTHDPAPGKWMVEVSSGAQTNVDFTMSVTVRSVAATIDHIEATFTVPPRNPGRDVPPELGPARDAVYGAGDRDFAEVNLNMRPGDGFDFSWSADGPLYFNVHYHGADGTERPIEERGDALEGTFTANLTEVYALLWRNEGTEPVDVRVSIDGSFRLHSMTRE